MRAPLPAKGQPLDISYIYMLADTVNKLADDIAVDKLTEWGYKGSLRTSASKLGLDSGWIHVAKTGTPTFVTVNFVINYSEPPIIVVSMSDDGAGMAGYKNKVSISKRTTGSASFAVEFDPNLGEVDLSWIAIGVSR